ncbi:unnamed protein product [Rodentolepis nana]|uniref:Membrane spanning protein n=1 Tax=Rodentolepis nana TaxID=102285 RepID=A0A0R3TFU5_RODNA|nr:unnamed protein product [Rodentolepis nana]
MCTRRIMSSTKIMDNMEVAYMFIIVLTCFIGIIVTIFGVVAKPNHTKYLSRDDFKTFMDCVVAVGILNVSMSLAVPLGSCRNRMNGFAANLAVGVITTILELVLVILYFREFTEYGVALIALMVINVVNMVLGGVLIKNWNNTWRNYPEEG